MTGRTGALLALVRWQNALLSATGVLIGAWWAHGRNLGAAPFVAAAAALLLTAYANTVNDVCDVAIDRVAHPERPLPRGLLTTREAWRFALGAAVGAVALSAVASRRLLPLSVAVLALMTLYSLHLKRWGLLGNVVVAVLASLPFLYGAISVGAPRPGLQLMYVAMPLHLAREVAKDLDDAEADAPFRQTLPVIGGPWLARVVLLLALAAFAWQALRLAALHPQLRLALVPAFVLCIAAAVQAVGGRRSAPLLLKAAMLAAMAALLVAR